MVFKTMHPWTRNRMAATLLAACCCFAAGSATAADIPWPAKARFQSIAQKKDLREMLSELALSQGVTISVADGVEGSVSGRFDMKPQAMLDLLASSHGFIWYYDGSLLHVMPASSVRTEVIQLRYGNIEQLRTALTRLGVLDRRYPLHDNGDGSTVVVSGPARYVELVQQIADHMEGTAGRNQATEVRVFPLQFAWAADHEFASGGQTTVVSGVASVIRSMYQPDGSGPRSGLFASLQKVVPAKHLKLSDNGSKSSSSIPAVRPTEANRGVGLSGSEDPADELPVVQADPRINAVLIRDIPSRMKQYETLIQQLDVRPQMIEIEARIIEISSDEAEKLGVDWRLQTQPTANAGNNLNRLRDVRDFTAGGGVMKTVLHNAGLNLIERITALAAEGKANVTASPTVLTLNNLEARMDNLESFFVRVAGRETAELFNISAGVTMRVTPMIVTKGTQRRIKLDVRIEDGSINDRTIDDIPVVKRSEISTQAFVRNGDALLVAGYAVEKDSKGEARVPGFSAIPVVGNLFKYQEANKSKTQRLFLLTPRIVDENIFDDEDGEIVEPAAEKPAAAGDDKAATVAPAPSAPAAVTAAPAAAPAPAPVAPEPVAPEPPPAPPVPTWKIYPTDNTLRTALTRWADSAGWQLLWELPFDYQIEAGTEIPGSFEEAVTAVSVSMEQTDVPMKVIFYKANKVLRIIAKEAE